MNKPFYISVASDYMIVKAQWFEFYYGYEYPIMGDAREEWCFVAKKDNKIILQIPFSVLARNYEIKSMDAVEECFAAGLAWFCVQQDQDAV